MERSCVFPVTFSMVNRQETKSSHLTLALVMQPQRSPVVICIKWSGTAHGAPLFSKMSTPEILRNRHYAKEYLAHVAWIRELLDQSSLTTNTQLLSSSSNRLYQSLSGLLTHASDIFLSTEPIPVWNLVRVVRLCDSTENREADDQDNGW